MGTMEPPGDEETFLSLVMMFVIVCSAIVYFAYRLVRRLVLAVKEISTAGDITQEVRNMSELRNEPIVPK